MCINVYIQERSRADVIHHTVVPPCRSINTWFGSMVLTDTGILLNNQMDDFGPPGDPLVGRCTDTTGFSHFVGLAGAF